MALSITHTPVYCTDLDAALAFYTQRLGFEVRDAAVRDPSGNHVRLSSPLAAQA